MDSAPLEQPAAGAAPPTLMHRIFSRHLMSVALLLLMPMLFAPFLNLQRLLVIDPDTWWHLANARLLLQSHHFIWADPYSFTVLGERWVNPEWLSEIPLWISYRAFHLQGLYLAAWMGICANILLVYWRGVRTTRNTGAAFYAAGIAVLMMTVNCSPRTIQFAYIAMSIELAILETPEPRRGKLLWTLPFLFMIWVNLHGSWLIGLMLLGLYIACGWFAVNAGVFAQQAFTPAERKRLLAVFGASVVALFVNPYGWRLVWNPFDMIFNQNVNTGTISEWSPLTFSTLEGFGVLAGVALMVIASCLRGRKWRVHELAFVLFAWFSAFDHHRFAYLAAVIVTPFLAADFARSFLGEPDQKTIPGMNALLAAAAACAMFFLFPSEADMKKGIDTWFPPRLLSSIQPGWRTWNWDDLGGMMTFMGKPDFIDSRVDIFEHHGVLQDYLAAMHGYDVYHQLDKHKIDHVLVIDTMPIAYLLTRTCNWHVVAKEGDDPARFVLLAKDATPAPGCVAQSNAPLASDATTSALKK